MGGWVHVRIYEPASEWLGLGNNGNGDGYWLGE